MRAFLRRLGLEPGSHLRQADLDRLTRRHPFSAFLYYLA